MLQVPATLDVLFHAIGGVIVIVGVLIAMRALFRDRARGRFRCPKCWYDLTPSENSAPSIPIMCSECGRVTKKLRRLRKTRRRWRRVAGAMVVFAVAGAVAIFPQVQRNGVWSVVPTWFLVDSLPVVGMNTVLAQELVKRFKYRFTGAAAPPPPAVRAYVARRIARGNVFARPISPKWRATYGELAHRLHFLLGTQTRFSGSAGEFHPAFVEALMEINDLPPVVEARTRPRWPEGSLIWIEYSVEEWWTLSDWFEVIVNLGNRRYRFESKSRAGFEVDASGLPADGELALDSAVLVDLWPANSDATSPERVEKFHDLIRVPCQIEGSIDDFLTPFTDSTVDDALRNVSLQPNLVNAVLGGVRFTGAGNRAIGVIIEYERDGKVRAAERVWWSDQSPLSPFPEAAGRAWVQPKPAGDTLRFASGQHWTLRIRSDPEAALRVFNATEYWQGDVTVDITIP